MPQTGDSQTARNGTAGVRWLATAGGSAALYDDPMSKVLGLDAKTSTLGAWFGFTSGSTLLLVGLMAMTSVFAWLHTTRLAAEAPEEIDVMKEDPPPPPPPIERESKPEPAAPAPHHAREAPPPAPAQAAKVLTQEPDPNEPVDLTGNTIVQGNADAYAGGFTTANGTNANAVRAAAAPTGAPGGTGAVRPAPPVTGPERARRASVNVSDTEWNCPFPAEANAEQIDDARVPIQVDVRPDGTPAAVRVLRDPGHGFAREAQRCAMSKRFLPALDHDGSPIAGTTNSFVVHFQLQ
jgi:periplasmic protein TonB